ncbi:HD domain-containing protein [Aliiglaciecola sp. LCG003]|uniref:HD domain-containing protein n=1 Tax=Aliiglaciecola sp. LCG003 TaxID=3053655 RepID=UPI002572DE89|nr:HD domain-containing protein [Aliiglaciecola sp. LCG003]WJG09260.1 HD domain-containing protein [Aliiglaciecola sp. LCG003]
MDLLSEQIEFINELDKLKAVQRKTLVQSADNRQENSAEHSWHIALVAQVFAEHAEVGTDMQRVVSMLLIHDIVEIDAGDMFAFAHDDHHQEQALKEIAAANRIFGLLPDSMAETFKSLWFEFEQATSVDARFAKAMDRVLPVFQNMSNGGGSWKIHGVAKQQVLKRNAYLQDSAPALWDYVNQQLDLAVSKGWLTE